MKEIIERFKKSNLFFVVSVIFPIIAVIVSVMLWINTKQLEILSHGYQNQIKNKEGQIALLNGEINQYKTQLGSRKSEVELLTKLVDHSESLKKVELLEKDNEIKKLQDEKSFLTKKITALEEIKSEFGDAKKIAETIAGLKQKIDTLADENTKLKSKIDIYEPKSEIIKNKIINEGNSINLLNNNLTIGVEDAYGTWGYINVSSKNEILYEREEVRPGINVPINIKDSLYTLSVLSITKESITFSLLK